jgi:hypothetical protein
MNAEEELFEFYKPEFEIYEGLITSYPLYSVERILKDKYEIKCDYNKNAFSLRFLFSENKSKAKQEINNILQITNNLGWFPSFISSYSDDQHFKKDKWDSKFAAFDNFISERFLNILFSFEAKYDIVVDKYPRVLYHVCPANSINKILKNGLSPKSRSKKAFHPERVYLFFHIQDAYEFAYKLSVFENINDIGILKVDTATIEYYLRLFRRPNEAKKPKLKLYKDPNYSNKALYTLNHITPYCLSLQEVINF